jgi:hypothetical protein
MPRLKEQYKIFLILERELWLQENGQFPVTTSPTTDDFELFANLPARFFPPRPDRYAALILPDDWFIRKSAKELSSHVIASIITSWESVQEEIRVYVSTIALIISNRRDQIIRSNLQPIHQSRFTNLGIYQYQLQSYYEGERTSLSGMNSYRLAMHRELNRLSSIVASECGFSVQEEPASFIESGLRFCQPANQVDNLSPIAASRYGLGLQENPVPVIGGGPMFCQPANQQLDNFLNVDDVPNIQALWAQEWDDIQEWASTFIDNGRDEVAQKSCAQPASIEPNVTEAIGMVDVEDDEILKQYQMVK